MSSNLLENFKQFLIEYRESWNSCDASRMASHLSKKLKVRWARTGLAVNVIPIYFLLDIIIIGVFIQFAYSIGSGIFYTVWTVLGVIFMIIGFIFLSIIFFIRGKWLKRKIN